MSKSRRVMLGGPWPIRVIWLLLPLLLGAALGEALDPRSEAIRWVAGVMIWAAWTLGVVAVLVPRTLGLTVIRVLAPTALPLGVWSALQPDVSAAAATAAVVAGAAAAVAALAPSTGDAFVNGSAYGAERRFALRPPAAVVFGPVQLVWAAVVAGAITGPLLFAAGHWVPGAVVSVVGLAVAVVGCRAVHQLSRRWLVMVPAGVVVHDPTVVTSQLFARSAIASMGPAPADTGALDLTGGAPGLAVEIQLSDTVTIEQLRRPGGGPRMVHATAVIITPTRPGAVLEEAAARRIRVVRPS
ncbi:MAG: hypothetical protein ACXIVQ_08290 [Acidimicrobiales bacterium]